jgi:hypothetical protein
MYNLNYTPTTLGVQHWREIISGGTRTKKVEYHCSSQSAHGWRWGCQPHAPAALYPDVDFWYSFLLQAESTPEPCFCEVGTEFLYIIYINFMIQRVESYSLFLRSPTCERCLEKEESATHILCDCDAIAYLRFRHLGHCFIEPARWLPRRPYK